MRNINRIKLKKAKPSLAISGLTLVEMLVVVLIIGILISIMIPVLAHLKIRSKAKLARLDCTTIAQAITQYNFDNIGRFPVIRGVAPNTDGGDITFSAHNNPKPNVLLENDQEWKYGEGPSNAQIMIILSALEGMGNNPGINKGHSRNSKKFNFLGVSKFAATDNSPGMGPNGIFRDPFGNPYVVTIDKSGDDKCWDILYGKTEVSGAGPIGSQNLDIGAHGLMGEKRDHDNDSNTPPVVVGYALMSKAMVWSAGPDRVASDQHKAKAEEFEVGGHKGTNDDNIIGW